MNDNTLITYFSGSRAERAEIRCGVLYNNEEYNVILSTFVPIR